VSDVLPDEEAYEIRARLVKASRLVDVLEACGLTGDDVRTLVESSAPVLGDVVRVAGVLSPSARTWETVAVLVDERRRVSAALRARAAAGGGPG
jgi:hypothetical protein